MGIANTICRKFQLAAGLIGLTLGLSGHALASLTDLGSAPLAYSTTTQVKPNVMFMLDDSGSMAWDYMPDTALNFAGKYGFESSQCNGVYYNPNIAYTPPVKADGTYYPNSSFASAWTDGYAATGSVNLNTQFKGGSGSGSSGASGYSGGTTAFYYQYSGTQLAATNPALVNYSNTGSTFYKECNSAIGSSPGNAVFSKVALSSTVSTTLSVLNNVTTIFVSGSSSSNTVISGITVNGVQILSTSTGGSANSNTVANLIASYINNCTSTTSGNCTTSGGTGYSAVYNVSTLTNAGAFVVGQKYTITSVGTTSFTSIGASANTVGTLFTATGAGTGSGTATSVSSVTLTGPADAYTVNVSCNGGSYAAATTGTCGGTHFTITAPAFPNLLNTYVTHIMVGTTDILGGGTGTTSATSTSIPFTMADDIAASITAHGGGYSATAAGTTNMVTIIGPSTASGFAPVVTACTNSTTCSTTNSISGALQFSTNPFPTINTAQLQNFANWYSYYSNRMLMMKTGVGLAFKPITSNYRVGFMTMNNNVSPGFLDTLDFSNCTLGALCQKDKWYTKLYASQANNSTPLREALSHVGQYYAHKFNGAPFYTSTITVSGSGSTIVDSVKVAATGTLNDAATGTLKDELLNAATPLDSSTSALATDIANQINAMVTTDYGATVNGSVVTIYGPAAAAGKTPVIVDTGGMTETATAFVSNASPSTLNGVSPADPMQYSCQQNFVILSTDGYWNGSYTYDLAGSTTGIGNQDGAETRTPPRLDGTNTSNTLSDVAEYYYNTDLRDISLTNCTGVLGTDVCANNVPTSQLDTQNQQHMTTFTLGLGARGVMVFDPTWPYETDKCAAATITSSDADYCAIYNGTTASSSVCTWQTPGTTCNWPIPANTSIPANIDDLWHASINGHGSYFNATNPAELSTGLYNALTGINARIGGASASATSSPNLTQTSHSLFSSTYETATWDGDVKAEILDPATGKIQQADTTCVPSTTILCTPYIAWSAQAQLDTLVNSDTTATISSRTIYTFDSSNALGNNLKPFLYGDGTAANGLTSAEQAYFNNQCTSVLSQCTTANLGTANLAVGDNGANMVNWLRGSQALEAYGTGSVAIYRPRAHILGDTVDAKPLFVKFPSYNFADTGYSAYVTAQTTTSPRIGMLYMASNDGMLHAFNADIYLSDNTTLNPSRGKEMWAYVPRMVMPNLYKLADAQYATNHQYYVDGSPETMDIYDGTNWRTILVGGLNGGGQGYYALDVTDPSNPKALWEFCSSSTLCPTYSGFAHSDADMGYSYGNPVITKRSTDGKWVVLVTSGYNNVSGSNPGQGFLYELDAVTGQMLHKTSTGTSSSTNTVAPSATAPTGLAKISAWFDNSFTNMTTRFIYGGDMNGDVWRFDLGPVGTDGATSVTRLASLKDSSSSPQPVTTRPQFGNPSGNVSSLAGTGNPAVFVSTGRYLGMSDLTNYQVQSVYGIQDDLSQTSSSSPTHYYGSPRSYAGTLGTFVPQYIFQPSSTTAYVAGATTRTTSTNAVNWTTNSGWYADLQVSNPSTINTSTTPSSYSPVSPAASPGERVNIDPQLINSTLLVVTNVPTASACDFGGVSWLYSFNFLNGQFIPTAGNTNVAIQLPSGSQNSLTAGVTVVSTTAGTYMALVTSTSGNTTSSNAVILSGATKRTSWRELTQ